MGILFEEGTYAELTFAIVSPNVSGVQQVPVPPTVAGAQSGDMTNTYRNLSFGFKSDLSDMLSLAVILDEPIGANVSYAAGTGYVYGGSTATVNSRALTTVLRYKLPSNVSVYGGFRYQEADGDVALFNGYTLTTDTARDVGYLVGVAWEKPEIAARVALTYNSSITHQFTTIENIAPTATSMTTKIPQSVNLEFQTGVAADTLVFGSVRWVDWSVFDITPQALGAALVDYTDSTITYTLGVGRRFNETWAGAVTLAYEPSVGGFSGNLGPTDGFTSLGVGATYTRGNVEISGGVRYIWIGGTQTQAPAPYPPGTTLGLFSGNHGAAAGMKIAYNF